MIQEIKLPTIVVLVSHITLKSQNKAFLRRRLKRTEMVAEKSGPSFASILTILSIVMYTGGFLRIELEFNKQKDKVNQLESVVESMKTSKGDDIAQGKLV